MSQSKLIVVIGATGNQGGSVVNTYLQDPTWRIRGLTRSISSPKATALKDRGVEVVQADMYDPSSLAEAFKDANAIFAVTDFWSIFFDPSNQDKPAPGQALNEWAKGEETQQLKNVVDAAAKVSTLERLVVSTLPNVTKLTEGKYKHVCHFDSKANAVDYAEETYPDLWAKTSLYKAGFFLTGIISDPAGKPTKTQDGTIRFTSFSDLDTKVPWIAHDEDSGPFVKALIDEPAGKNLIAYRDWLTPRELTALFTEATGYKAEIVQSPLGEFWFPCPPGLRQEFCDHFAYCNEFGYEGRNDPTLIHPKDLDSPPKLGNVVEYLQKQDWDQVLGN